MYELKGINEVSNGTGIVFFNFHRKNKNSAPKLIKGFSADLHNNEIRTKSIEYKLSDSTDYIDSDAIEKAVEFYQEIAHTFNHLKRLIMCIVNYLLIFQRKNQQKFSIDYVILLFFAKYNRNKPHARTLLFKSNL
ncbi:hypothetical protein C8N46_10955 [Kordia periserrulae]|uniref:Uncharacterized protein n=2 Tax=Kordia periserrulae TaxID=701523 RepID=A0A2T6BU03_9FLAO|nr:hypothetical protein C8N46_10955 [Kordia periserrulae]